MSEQSVPPDVRALIERSRVLGSDPRVTNYAGGNTSCKVQATDPVTGGPVTLMYVKGSGGDLGTLTVDGLAVLVLDRIGALRDVYPGEEREDEMVALLEHCRFGPGGAAPSIDTPLHALLPAPHVDHVHPDAVIALAACADGEELVKECYGDEVGWVPWRRPGFELALEMDALYRASPGLRGIVLGGHGLFTWGETSAEAQEVTLEIIRRAEEFIAERSSREPFGPVVEARRGAGEATRRALAGRLGPAIRGLCSTDRRMVGRFRDDPVVLSFLEGAEAERLAQLGTSCPDHFLRTKVRPLFVDVDPSTEPDAILARARELHAAYREEYRAYYERHAVASSPAIRGADPAIVLVPGVGMWSFGADPQTARVAGEFYVNAINVMRGAEGVSTYTPIPESEKFRIEYWELEEAKLRRRPPAPPLTGRVALVTGAASGIGRAIAQRLSQEGAVVIVADLDAGNAAAVAADLGGADRAAAVAADVSDPGAVEDAVRTACVAYGGIDLVVNCAGLGLSKPLLDTSVEDWDRVHGVLSRGSFLVSRAAARVMVEQGIGGDIVYIVSKNAVAAGPENIAYGSAKADQAHQVRLLAAELGSHGIRVNGVNPDGVVRGSGIFAGEWGDKRAELYGVEREKLGEYYAGRTLLKREVLPEHVAAAVFAFVSGDLELTTGTIVPVDSGVPSAFLR